MESNSLIRLKTMFQVKKIKTKHYKKRKTLKKCKKKKVKNVEMVYNPKIQYLQKCKTLCLVQTICN